MVKYGNENVNIYTIKYKTFPIRLHNIILYYELFIILYMYHHTVDNFQYNNEIDIFTTQFMFCVNVYCIYIFMLELVQKQT